MPSQVDQDHATFLKRNGLTIAAILDANAERLPSRGNYNLLHELTILIATEQVPAFLDGRALRGLDAVLRIRPETRARWTTRDWIRELRGNSAVRPGAESRLERLHAVLRTRHDFPNLEAMKKWGQPRWRAFMEEIGADVELAGTVTALLLDRREMPSGRQVRHIYERIGFNVKDGGRPAKREVFEEDHRSLKWGLARLAATTCRREVKPGVRTCQPCPLKKFCLSYRNLAAGRRSRKHRFVDFFAGGGGMSLGFSNGGFHLARAVEFDRHAADTLYANHPESAHGVVDVCDIRKLRNDRTWRKKAGAVDVVVGGPPCQPFSLARRHSNADKHDPRRYLFRDFIFLARKLNPKFIVMENVPGILNAAGGRILESVKQDFAQAGFVMKYQQLSASDFGVPQNRNRIFFIAASRKWFRNPGQAVDKVFAHLERAQARTPQVTAEQALSGLPHLGPGEGGEALRSSARGRRSTYAAEMSSDTGLVFNHEARAHNARDIRIFSALRWGETAAEYAARDENHEIPYQLESFGDKYRKIHPERPAPTIPSHLRRDANSFVHPFVPRGITGREAARLQSFPDSYMFMGGFGAAFTQVGNAVPPRLAEAVARGVRLSLDANVLRQPGPAARKRRHPRVRRAPRSPRRATRRRRVQHAHARRGRGSRAASRPRRRRG